MRPFLITILFLVFLIESNGQEINRKYSIGINLPPLNGSTIDLKLEYNRNAHWTGQIGLGAMIRNQLSGSIYKVYDGLTDFNNSGLFVSTGIR